MMFRRYAVLWLLLQGHVSPSVVHKIADCLALLGQTRPSQIPQQWGSPPLHMHLVDCHCFMAVLRGTLLEQLAGAYFYSTLRQACSVTGMANFRLHLQM